MKMYYYDVEISEDVLHYKAFNEDGQMVGLLQVRPEIDQYLIEGLYVAPDHREKGIASDLLDDFLGRISDQNILPCTCTFSEEYAGEELYYFFDSRDDFTLIEAGKSYYCRNNELMHTPVIQKLLAKGPYPNIKSLKDLSKKELNQLLMELKDYYLDTVSDSGELTEYYDSELSSVYSDDRGITAAILVSDVNEGNAFIETVFFKDKGLEGMKVAADVIRKIANRDDEMTLSFFAINDESEKLLDNLLENTWSSDKFTTYIANWMMVTS